jgi:hypothetical protein
MLQQTTNLGKPKPKEFHAVVDENSPSADTLGRVLGVFSTAAKATRFAGNLSHAAKLSKTGARIDLAFSPRVNTGMLCGIIAENPNVRPRILELKSDLPPGTNVHAKLHVAHSGPPRGALRCL